MNNRPVIKWRPGFTLVELALAIGVGLIVSGMALALFNQQLAFIRILRAQDFLTREAPLINNSMVRVVGLADGYLLYPDLDELRGGGQPVLEDASVLLLRFRQPDGTFREGVLSFEDDPTLGQGLYYRVMDEAGNLPEEPDWWFSRQPEDVNFSVEQGILRMRIDGPNGERLTYSGTDS